MKTVTNRASQSGFTIIEILISTVIVSIIMVTAIAIYLTAYRGYDRGNVINLIQNEGNRITDIFTRTIHSSVKAEVIAGVLRLEMDTDSIEYQENGQCKFVALEHQPPTATDNGSIVQTFESCIDIPGGYTNVISNQGALTAVNVTEFLYSVTSDASQKTYLIDLDFKLARSIGENDRSGYKVEVPFNTKISTRGYIN